MARKTQPMSTRRRADDRIGEDKHAERVLDAQGELRITQDINPSGLGLMPHWMARRIVEAVSRGRSSHA
jgi:hypothetical protein